MERFAFKGVASNLVTYLTDVMGMSNSSAAKYVNGWVGIYVDAAAHSGHTRRLLLGQILHNFRLFCALCCGEFNISAVDDTISRLASSSISSFVVFVYSSVHAGCVCISTPAYALFVDSLTTYQ
ncbi:protein NRT1/ PTR FAMILY 5.9 [Sesamum angolense]|uniref:Protein NRT1/ PTR FAMILY 5.9 n=1 Tax=Sesamum angolense TaxID=2727404 RepID=A0AAE1WGR8_9LAMI|nr:protein NRT1/ PTR FAMILY 5.9 [Sesamum angolense]